MKKIIACLTILPVLVITGHSCSQKMTQLDSLIRAVNLMKEDSVKGINLLTIGFRLRENYPDSSLYYFNKCRQIAKKINCNPLVVNSYINSSNLNAERGNGKQALMDCDSAEKYYRKMKDTINPDLLQIRGNIYLSIGNYDSAAANYFRVVRAREQTGEVMLNLTYQNLCELFNTINQPEEALKYAMKHYELALKFKDDDEIAWAAVDICESYNGMSKAKYARKYVLQLYELSKKSNDTYIKVYAMQEMGTVYYFDGDFRKAVSFYESALKQCENLFEQLSVCRLLNNLARVHYQLRNYADAEKYLLRSVKLCKEISARTQLQEAYEILGANYAAKKDFIAAYNYTLLSKSLGDSLLSEKSLANMQQLSTKYETENKERKILLLNTEKQLQTAEADRQKALKTYFLLLFLIVALIAVVAFYNFRNHVKQKQQQELTRISRDLHDDIGATLSSISYTSEIAKQKLQTNSSNDALKFIEIIGDDARAMVSNMSDIVWSLSSDNNDCEKLFERMRNYASPLLSSRDINFHFNRENISESNFIRPEIRQNLYLIFKEAINNAAKYSGAKNVYVDIKLFDHTFEMKIKDDGKGFETSPPTPLEESGQVLQRRGEQGGNGLTNMKIRAKSMNGNFEIKSSKENGTEIIVEKKSM